MRELHSPVGGKLARLCLQHVDFHVSVGSCRPSSTRALGYTSTGQVGKR